MGRLKQILTYTKWTVIALLLGVIYMRMLLGPGPDKETYTWFLPFFEMFYNFGLLYLGLIIGGIIALFYILFDIFYLKGKLEYDSKSIAIRFMVLLVIAIGVGGLHYLLEKVIDII